MNKRIYITALHLGHGGVEMAISLLSGAFIKKGYEVTILSLYRLGDPAYFIPDEVKIEYLTDLKPNKEEFFAAIKSKNPIRILKEGLYSVKVLRKKKTEMIKRIQKIQDGTIISTRNEHSVILSRYGQKKVHKIAQLHHDHLFDSKLLNDFQNHYENIDVFTLLTDELTKEVKKMLEGKNEKTLPITMPNFLPETPPPPPLEKKEKVVLAVGRLSPEKGFLRLLEIWKEVSKIHPDWSLHLVGDGDQRKALMDYARENRLDSVLFLGTLPHDRVTQEMQKASLYAMTSHSEGFGFVIIEAFASALPVVAFDVRVGPRAIIEHEKSGILVPDGEKTLYVKAICDLMEDEEKRWLFSKNAQVRSNDFTEEKIIERWISILHP